MTYFINILLLFFIYSFVGWCIEVTLKYRQFGRFINRGFLTGPWLPIYGSGAVLITLSNLGVEQFESAYGTTFAISFVVCGIVEYAASYFMEKRFHARWWDYSQKPMNLQGRIWIGNLILFGIGGVAIVWIANPFFYGVLNNISLIIRQIIAGILAAVFITDYIVSHFVLKLVKVGVERSDADNTEEISKEVRLLLSDRSYFYRRFADAYPDVIYRTEKINQRIEKIKAETEVFRMQMEESFNEISSQIEESTSQLKETLEPVGVTKNIIIEKQAQLIDLLYDEAYASDEMKEIKSLIDKKYDRLKELRIIKRE